MIKVVELLARKPGMTRAECHRYWQDVHGAMVLDTPAMVANMRRSSQSHTVDDELVPVLPPTRYDGLAELCFDDDDLASCFGPEYLATVHLDESSFVDLEQATGFVAIEHLIYERDG